MITVSASLPPEEVSWAMHLIDHDEPAEGLVSLAWAIEREQGAVDPPTASLILELTRGLVPTDSLPPTVQADGTAIESTREMPRESE